MFILCDAELDLQWIEITERFVIGNNLGSAHLYPELTQPNWVTGISWMAVETLQPGHYFEKET